jgi:hypothetical protein
MEVCRKAIVRWRRSALRMVGGCFFVEEMCGERVKREASPHHPPSAVIPRARMNQHLQFTSMASELVTASLPSPSELLTSIINQLSTLEPAQAPDPAPGAGPLIRRDTCTQPNANSNPLSSLPIETITQAKSLLLTLHFLFPNELLLALDILDRNLVKRCCVRRSHQQTGREVYFVRSQSSPSATGSRDVLLKSYEVHLDSWNCMCAAFTLAIVRSLDGLADRWDEDDRGSEMTVSEREMDWRFGGSLTTRKMMPPGSSTAATTEPATGCVMTPPPPACCKHLLACVLAARCPRLFGGGVEEVDVDLDDATSAGRGKIGELVAWHSGWCG